MIRKVIYTIFSVAALAYFGFSVYLFTLRPCDKPLEYAIGRFDNQFGVTKDEFRERILLAENVWENALGKDVFLYDPDASFKINLIYDERQISTIQKQKTESGFTQAESALKLLDSEFAAMKNAYEASLAAHKSKVVSFELRQKEYQTSVEYWNKKGGAPKKEYEELQLELKSLNEEVVNLNQETSVLNTKAAELNTLLERRNEAARAYNIVAQEYNKKYGQGLEFDQAEYTGNEINVYQFGNRYDLTLALTHELGHALGMDHVENANSVMYYVTGGNANPNTILTKEDLAELNRVCKK